MNILVFALILILIVALCIYAIDLLPLGQPFNGLAKALVILIAVVLLIQRAGLV